MSSILELWSRRIAAAAVYLWPGGKCRRIQTQKAQYEFRECRTSTRYFH